MPDFQPFYFGPEWSDLALVEIPTYGWSLDNLYVFTIPEPGMGALVLMGTAALTLRFIRKRRQSL